MNLSVLKGVCFGLTSGIITTLGMIVGLDSFSGSRLVVLGGIITIAVADSFSDALGIHISEESDKKTTGRQVWTSTIATFISKLIFSSTFIIPVLVFDDLGNAVIASIAWGISILAVLSYFIAKDNKERPWKVISEHLLIAGVVIFITHFVGDFVSMVFV